MHRLLIIILCGLSNNIYSAEDPVTGLIIAPGWELVRVHCGVCHSYKLVTAQRADKEGWRDMIKWMQETQNLWEFEPKTEEGILDYLATSYPPRENHRRAPIVKNLMPVTR